MKHMRKGRTGKRPKKNQRKVITPRQRLSFWLGLAATVAIFTGLFFVAEGGVYLPSAISAQTVDVDLHRIGVPATGTIIEVKRSSTPHTRPGGGSTTYYPVTVQDRDGGREPYTWARYQTTNPDLWVEGEQLAFLYDPNKPHRMVIDSPAASELLERKVRSNQQLLLIGVPGVLVGFALKYVSRRLDPKPRKKRKLAAP